MLISAFSKGIAWISVFAGSLSLEDIVVVLRHLIAGSDEGAATTSSGLPELRSRLEAFPDAVVLHLSKDMSGLVKATVEARLGQVGTWI